jgi:hypothetical protein
MLKHFRIGEEDPEMARAEVIQRLGLAAARGRPASRHALASPRTQTISYSRLNSEHMKKMNYSSRAPGRGASNATSSEDLAHAGKEPSKLKVPSAAWLQELRLGIFHTHMASLHGLHG